MASRLLVVLVVFAAAGGATPPAHDIYVTDDYSRWPNVRVLGEVPRINLHGMYPDVETIVKSGHPMVLYNTGMQRSKWTPEFMSRESSKEKFIARTSSPLNLRWSNCAEWAPLSAAGDETWLEMPRPYDEAWMSMRDFYNIVENGTARESGEYLYVSLAMEEDEVRAFAGDIESMHTGASPSASFWSGSEGATAGPHFDMSENFFMQIYGYKRFILAPPATILDSHVFPRVSPHYRQIQHDLLKPSSDVYPRFNQTKVIVATLGPGDILYTPSFWIHQVTTLNSTGIGFNVFSSLEWSHQFGDMQFLVPLPFEMEWGMRQRIDATRLFLSMLVDETIRGGMSFTGPSQVFRSLYEGTFAPLEHDDNIRRQVEASSDAATTRDYCMSLPEGESALAVARRWDFDTAKFLARGLELWAVLEKIPNPSIRTVILEQYMQEVAFWAVGGRAEPMFWRHCPVVGDIGDLRKETGQ